MSKIDPITGCEVASIWDLVRMESEETGKSSSEIMQEFFDDWDESSENCKLDLDKRLLEIVAEKLKTGIEDGDYDDDSPIPVKRISGSITAFSDQMRGNKWTGVLMAQANDGKNYRYTITHNESYGDFYEPPDCEEIVEWDEMEE